MAISDDIGGRGQAICYMLLTQFCGQSQPRFRPYFLGEKFPALDYLVELVGASDVTSFFFVQVRATTLGYTKGKEGSRRLKIRVDRGDMQRLIRYPTPTYIVGIDERDERGYLLSVQHDSPAQIASLPTTFLLDCQTLALLWDEVSAFWMQRDMRLLNSRFTASRSEASNEQ